MHPAVRYNHQRRTHCSDWRVDSLSSNTSESTLFLSPLSNLKPGPNTIPQERENRQSKRERNRVGRERERERERERSVCVLCQMASMPLGPHHHQPPPTASLQPQQPSQLQAQSAENDPLKLVARRSADMETDKVLTLWHSLIVRTQRSLPIY